MPSTVEPEATTPPYRRWAGQLSRAEKRAPAGPDFLSTCSRACCVGSSRGPGPRGAKSWRGYKPAMPGGEQPRPTCAPVKPNELGSGHVRVGAVTLQWPVGFHRCRGAAASLAAHGHCQ
jgi:hypothetical protein